MDRYAHLRATMGDELFGKVQAAKLLVVGAGGIGCELLKNLVLSGFRSIKVVDLDTIDVSNLNRQFLFRREHVGQSKAQVAAEAVRRFNPDAEVTAFHGNVKSAQFGLQFIKDFDLVFNALDNVDARRHVNRLCLAAKVPLVESGTTGFLGQVTVILKGETECYECQPKATQKQYPICTIRSTPDKPVHCIVWAKEAFKLLLGDSPNSMLYEDEGPDAPEPSVYMKDVTARPAAGAATPEILEYVAKAIKGQFVLEINKKLGMGTHKGAAKPPSPIDAADVDRWVSEHGKAPSTAAAAPGWDRKAWDAADCVRELAACLVEAFGTPAKRESVGKMEFDKDDRLAMRFVTAACNLRQLVFHIEPLQSLYEAKGIAGNIVPAIATTNAIVAGLQVLEAFKLLDAKKPVRETCKYVYCLREPTRKGLLLQPTSLQPPSPACFVCNSCEVELKVDVERETLQGLVDRVLKGRLGFNSPSVGIGTDTLYEEGDGADENLRANLPKKLSELPAGGVHNGTRLSVDDFSQELELTINVTHATFDPDEVPEGFQLAGDAPPQPKPETKRSDSAAPTAAAAPAADAAAAAAGAAGAAGAATTMGAPLAANGALATEPDSAAKGNGEAAAAVSSKKRPREEEEESGSAAATAAVAGGPAKGKKRALPPAEKDVIMIEDDVVTID